VATQLDKVADRLASQPLAIRHSTTNRLMAYAEDRRGVIGIMAGVVGAIEMAVSMIRQIVRLPDQDTTRRLYAQATGVGRDQGAADLAVVADRLSPLMHAPNGAQGDALVRAASRRLVAWVAAGRPHDEQVAGVEAAFAQWIEVAEHDSPDPDGLVQVAESYVAAWEAATRRRTE
jgi:hypothetical protein